MTVGMLLMTIGLVLLLTGLLDTAAERMHLSRRAIGGWMAGMLLALLLPEVRLGTGRVNALGLAVTLAATLLLLREMWRRHEAGWLFLPGSLIAAALGLWMLLVAEKTADTALACALVTGAVSVVLGGSRRGMLLCAMMSMLLVQGVSWLCGWTGAMHWTDATALSVVTAAAVSEGARWTAAVLLVPHAKGGEQG